MLMSEEELPVEVAQVDRVKVDDVDLAIAGKHQVLEKLAADAASTNEEDTRLGIVNTLDDGLLHGGAAYLFDAAVESAERLLRKSVTAHVRRRGIGRL